MRAFEKKVRPNFELPRVHTFPELVSQGTLSNAYPSLNRQRTILKHKSK